MAVENNARLMTVRRILFEETDENNHYLSLFDLIERLKSIFPEATFDKRTIKGDIDLLDAMDFEIIRDKGRHGKILYSHQNRIFETYQLRLIIDAILSARFITDNEKNNLIEKLKRLTSKYIAKSLPNPVVFSQSANMDYELVKLNIDYIHRAIFEQKLLTYQYGKYNVNKQFEFNRDGAIYHVEPYGLIWQNDFYYLIARYLDNGELRHYRLDRIRNISIGEETFIKQPFDLHSYINQSFHMFAGEEIRIKIQFHIDLVNVVLDRFGHDVDIRAVDDDSFLLTTKAKLSDGLINWILTWGNKAKVLAPEHLVESVHHKIKMMLEVYE